MDPVCVNNVIQSLIVLSFNGSLIVLVLIGWEEDDAEDQFLVVDGIGNEHLCLVELLMKRAHLKQKPLLFESWLNDVHLVLDNLLLEVVDVDEEVDAHALLLGLRVRRRQLDIVDVQRGERLIES